MASRKPKNRKPNFFEALVMTPRLPGVSRLPENSTTQTSDLPESTPDPTTAIDWQQVRTDAKALLHDFGMYLRRVLANLFSLPARLTYLMVALVLFTAGTASAVQIGVSTMNKYQKYLSNPAMMMNEKNVGTTILDRNGEVLFQGYGAVDRHIIPFNEMPETLKQATLATEDPDFYDHGGVSIRGTARAAYQDLRHTATVQGGSTITQQLVKNTLLDNEKSFTRKYKELLLATDLERRYDKNQILQMYLNTIYYGQGAYGVEAASQTYFHKPTRDLTLAESALLAGLPQSPSLFDPNVSPESAKERRDYVLDRMRQEGYIKAEVAAATKQQPIQAGTRQIQIKAPHFVFYVINKLRDQYGDDIIKNGGIVVHTTLDYSKQVQAEDIVRNQVDQLASRNATNGGLVSIDPKTGDIINMVGSVDYNRPGFGAVNVTLAQLQPGSSFKPIAYATAFTKGWNGATKVDDKPMRVPQTDGTVYAPQNYDQKFRGPVLLRRALSNSLNIPAIEVLKYAGLPETISMAHDLGIQPPSLTEQSRYGLSLVLGGGEVRPIDMARVYATLANQGTTVTPKAINQVTDRFGDNITKTEKPVKKQVLDPRIVYMLTNILSDNNARKEIFGENSPLKLSRPAAVKTGTTNDYRDNWAIGFTPSLVTAVWVGNNDHSSMRNVDGVTGAAPIWHNYMEMALAGTPVEDFAVPSGVIFAKVCQADGGLVDDNDPNGVREVFLAESKPTKRCGWASPPPAPKPNPEPTPTPTPEPTQQATAPPSPETPGQGSGNDPGNPNQNPGTPPPNQNGPNRGNPGRPN